MDYFFKNESQKSDVGKTIKKKPEKYTHEELKKLAIDVLTVSFNFLRSSSEFKRLNMNSSVLKFQFAVTWFLSDSLHNIPANLENENRISS